MKGEDVIQYLKDLFQASQFQLCEEYSSHEYLSLYFFKKDFRVGIDLYLLEQELNLSLDKPFFGFNEEHKISGEEEIFLFSDRFIKKIDTLIVEESLIPRIKKEDCELFLKTGNSDGMSSGVIEYRGNLYYIQASSNTYYKDKTKEDSDARVWRHFYVHEMTKSELEKVIMQSLDWMRNINLTTLCKNWNNLGLKTGDKDDHDIYFKGKYVTNFIPQNKPVMKLTLFY